MQEGLFRDGDETDKQLGQRMEEGEHVVGLLKNCQKLSTDCIWRSYGVKPKADRVFDQYNDIVVEKILPSEKDAHYPRCLDGQRACPPEDVGGVWGYADFVKAIRNPRHPEHDEMLEWVGGEFDPDKFDLEGVNGMLLVFQSTLAYHARKK